MQDFPKISTIADCLNSDSLSVIEIEQQFIYFICSCLDAVAICHHEGINPQHLLDNHLPSGSESDNKFWQWVWIHMEQVFKELQPDSSQPITHTCITEVMGCYVTTSRVADAIEASHMVKSSSAVEQTAADLILE